MCQDKIIAVFHTTREVILANEVCRKVGLLIAVVPVPEEISSECGMCLEINADDKPLLVSVMKPLDIEMTLYDKRNI